MKNESITALLAFATFIAACQSANSENIKTPGIAASFRITDNKSGTAAAHAELKIGSTYIDLSGGDALLCNGIKLAKSEGVLNEIRYDATVARLSPGGSYEFDFNRPSSGESHASYAVAPEPVLITAPANGTLVSAKAPLSVSWQAAAQGSIGISMVGSGVHTRTYGVGVDAGTYTIPAGDLACEQSYKTCSAALTITRTVIGTGDPDFQSAGVQSITDASIDITIQM
jgi:hypothetical protein